MREPLVRIVLAASAGVAVATASVRQAHAQRPPDGCKVQVIPTDPPELWQSSVREVVTRVRGSAECRELTITLTTSDATLVFVTPDERRAVRVVDTPAALTAVAEALLVTVPATPEAPAPAASLPTLSAAPVGDASAPPADVPYETPPPPREWVFGASAGGRVAFPASYMSPTLGLSAGLSSARAAMDSRPETLRRP